MNDTRRLIRAFPEKLCLSAMARGLPPQLDAVAIQLNGAATPYEDFRLTRRETPFGFCKTVALPYDRIICGILAICRDRTALITVTSDGKIKEWQPHLVWASQVLRRALQFPVRPR